MPTLSSQQVLPGLFKATNQARSLGIDTTSNAGTFEYAANSVFQRLIYQQCEKYLPDLKGRKFITVVDYGCGSGQNWTHSLDLLLSKADGDVQYQLILNDGMNNDWNEVAQAVQDYRARECGQQKGHFAVLPGNFYQQIMPDQSVDVGMAWSSFHWLEKTPPPKDIPLDENYYSAWQESVRPQGHADLTKLLHLRAKEIRPGGHLLMVIPTTPSSTVKLHWEATVQALKRCLKHGNITPAQYRAFSGPWFQPTEEDLQQILSDVRDLWYLPMPWAYPTLPHPVWTKLQGSEKTRQDYEEYAEGFAGFFMALIRDSLVRALRGGDGKQLQYLSASEDIALRQFTMSFKEAVLSDSLRDKRAESSWLVTRLVRKPGAQMLESRANL